MSAPESAGRVVALQDLGIGVTIVAAILSGAAFLLSDKFDRSDFDSWLLVEFADHEQRLRELERECRDHH